MPPPRRPGPYAMVPYGTRQRSRFALRKSRFARKARTTLYRSAVPNVGLAAKSKPSFNTLITNLNFGIPESQYVKFRYHTDTTPGVIDPSATATNSWRLTNLTDPNYSVGGHQCMLWDQYSTFYQWCACYGVLIEFTIRPETTDQNFVPAPLNIGWAARAYDPSVGLASVYNDEYERPDAINGTVSTSGSSSANTQRTYINNARLVGKRSAQDFIDMEDFWVPMQSGYYIATKELLWTMLINNLSAFRCKVGVGITLTYYCKVFGKKHVNPSQVDGLPPPAVEPTFGGLPT